MTDQYQWQGALAAAEHAIREGQIERAADSLQVALTRISTYEPNDPARLAILGLFLRCCDRAITLADNNFHSQWNVHIAHLPTDRAILQEQSKVRQRLRNRRLSAYRLLLDSQLSQFGQDDTAVVSTLLRMAQLEWNRNELRSFPLLHRALTIREKISGADHPDTLAIVRQLASDYATLVMYEEAIPLWQRLLAYTEKADISSVDSSPYSTSGILFNLGKAYNYLRLPAKAKAVWGRYLALTEHPIQEAVASVNVFEPHQIDALYGVDFACLALQEWHGAARFLARAIDKHRTDPFHNVIEGNGVWLIDLAAGIAAYADAITHLGNHKRAIALCEEAIGLWRRRDLRYVGLLDTYAAALRASGAVEEASSIEREASELRASIEAKMRRWRSRSSPQR